MTVSRLISYGFYAYVIGHAETQKAEIAASKRDHHGEGDQGTKARPVGQGRQGEYAAVDLVAELGNGCSVSAYEPPLDPGIAAMVEALRCAGVETYESCEGGAGHAYPEPAVRFHGDQAEGLRALSVALAAGLPVRELRRVWMVLQQEPTGPWWELTFATGR